MPRVTLTQKPAAHFCGRVSTRREVRKVPDIRDHSSQRTFALRPIAPPSDRPSPPVRSHRNRPASWLRARVLVPECRLSSVRHLDPLLVGRCVCDVAVVPVPPLLGRGLRITLGPSLPDLLPPHPLA